MANGTHLTQRLAAGAARQRDGGPLSAATWVIGTGVNAAMKPCAHRVAANFGGLTHQRPEEAPL